MSKQDQYTTLDSNGQTKHTIEINFTDWDRLIIESRIASKIKLSTGEFAVLITLAVHCGRDPHAGNYGKCFPKQSTIAAETGLSVFSVRNNIVKLVDRGLIQRTKVRKLYHYKLSNVLRQHLFFSQQESCGDYRKEVAVDTARKLPLSPQESCDQKYEVRSSHLEDRKKEVKDKHLFLENQNQEKKGQNLLELFKGNPDTRATYNDFPVIFQDNELLVDLGPYRVFIPPPDHSQIQIH